MKKLKAKKDATCMACLACVNACAEAFYKVADPGKACVQCGKCAEACEAGAITQNAKGVYMVNKKLCTGCGKCVEACPFHIMVKAEDSPTASKCIACGICAKACPMDVLEVVES